MKKLSIEEKAQRYDEALKDAVVAHKDEDRHLKATLERIFPELKESKDEKIRKWLIGYFNQYIIDGMPQVFGNGLNVKDVIAWLEKQDENETNNNIKNFWSEEDDVGLADALWAIQKARTIAKDENDMGNLWCAERFLNSIKGRIKGE